MKRPVPDAHITSPPQSVSMPRIALPTSSLKVMLSSILTSILARRKDPWCAVSSGELERADERTQKEPADPAAGHAAGGLPGGGVPDARRRNDPCGRNQPGNDKQRRGRGPASHPERQPGGAARGHGRREG